jgi:hypothetical protein
MSKSTQTSGLQVNPDHDASLRKALLKEIASSNLSVDTKKKLVTDIQTDNPQQFMQDGGIQILEQLSDSN